MTCKYSHKLLSLLVTLIFFTGSYAQNKTVETSGDILLFAMPAAAIGTALIIGDKEGTWQFTKGFLLNQAVTFGLKLIVDKPRPDMSNNYSFPSGHTSTAFQSASFIQRRYGWKYGIPAFALAGCTAVSRIDANKHDGWDVLGGIVIGVGSTYLFTTAYQKEHLELTFNSNDDTLLLGFKYKF